MRQTGLFLFPVAFWWLQGLGPVCWCVAESCQEVMLSLLSLASLIFASYLGSCSLSLRSFSKVT